MSNNSIPSLLLRRTDAASFNHFDEVLGLSRRYPLFMPICSADGYMSQRDLASHLEIDIDVVAAWGIFARDTLMSRAVERGLLPRGTTPEGGSLTLFLRWFQNKTASHWTCVLSDSERMERRHVVKLFRILTQPKL